MTVLRGPIGGKMIVAPVLHVPVAASLRVIAVIIAGAAAASLHQSSRQSFRGPGRPPNVPGAPPARANVRRSTA